MKNLIIIGAGGFGREVYNLALSSHGYGEEFDIKGFLDDNPNALARFDGYPPVLGALSAYTIEPQDVFVCALGNIKPKLFCIKAILEKGGTFMNLVHRTAHLSMNVKMGCGCIICPGVSVECDVTIGDYVCLQRECLIGHDARIGDWVHMHPRVFIGGGVTIGNAAHMFPGAMVHPYKKVGDYANVGAGAFVIRNVKPETTVCGNPARTL